MKMEGMKGMDEYFDVSLRQIKEGDIIEGRILKITEREVFIDIGAKSEGICPLSEFKNPEEIKKGSSVYVYVEEVEGEDGFIILSKHKAEFILAWDKIKAIYDENRTINVKVIKKVKGGLVVDVFGVDAFLPGSQIDLKLVKNFSQWVGKEIPVKIIKINKLRKNIVVSRKAAIEEEIAKKRERIEREFKIGDIVEAEIRNLTNSAVFVDVNGIDGIVSVQELSSRKIKHPKEVVSIGEKMKFKIIGIDLENLTLHLSLKALLPSIWEELEKKYPLGERVRGKVKKILDYGILVELEPEIVGFVHLSEMSWKKSIKHPSEIVKEGMYVDAIVLDIDKEKGKISLGMKQTQPDPWSAVEENFPVGSVVRGIVKGFDNFGAFVELEEGIEGYLHIADISWTRRFHKPEEALKIGQKLKLKVIEVDRKNRILYLSLKHLRPDPWEEIKKRLSLVGSIKAPITEITSRGIVVEVDKGLEGFVPANHLSRKGNLNEIYKIGEEINLKVMKVEPQKKRILLSEKEYEKLMEKKEIEKFIKKTEEPVRIQLGEILRGELEKLFNIEEESEKES
uniref:30S ribosomal protein S1 n=1 Tax=candidate division WOR-3 bacterium TaxID=2052148 RepID=A0A7V4EB43_UNCW3